jgi:hypothetical protein
MALKEYFGFAFVLRGSVSKRGSGPGEDLNADTDPVSSKTKLDSTVLQLLKKRIINSVVQGEMTGLYLGKSTADS